MSDSEDEILLLVLWLALRRKRRRASLMKRNENHGNSHSGNLSRCSSSPQIKKKRENVDNTSPIPKMQRIQMTPDGSEGFMDLQLSTIKFEMEDEGGSTSFGSNTLEGIAIKDEPTDDWSGNLNENGSNSN